MIDWATVQAFSSGVFPDVLAINSTGAATQDGTEYIAAQLNNGMFGPSQALMDHAGLTPDGVVESASASQILEAIQLGHAIGPGTYRQWGKNDDPSVTGDRLLLLSGQGVLIASYPELDEACYVGDVNNNAVAAAGGKFYRSSDAPGATPNIAGPYLQLPGNNPTFLKQYVGGTDFTVTGTAGFTLSRGVLIPYQTSGGAFRLVGNIGYSFTSTADPDITITGVVFKSTEDQAITLKALDPGIANAIKNTANINVSLSGARTAAVLSLDLELNAKPTWADDFSFPWGIVY